MKQKITETPYKTATKTDVCSHLQPMLKALESNGNIVDRATGIICDKANGNIMLLEKNIEYDVIESLFELPEFIHLNKKKDRITCGKCWCSLEKKPDTQPAN